MDGMTSLHHAATSGHHKCVQALLEEGAGLNATLPSHTSLTPGATPLHMASCGGHVECVRVLVEYGAAVDLRDDQGWTPLVYADFVRNRDCVVALLQPKNVDVCARQLKNLGDLLQTDRGETKERVVKLIEYAATVPEFYDAINRLVSMDPDVLNRSMSFLLRNPALLNFSSKLAYVRLQLEESFNGSYYSGGFGAHSEVECNFFLDRRNIARDLIQQLLVKQRGICSQTCMLALAPTLCVSSDFPYVDFNDAKCRGDAQPVFAGAMGRRRGHGHRAGKRAHVHCAARAACIGGGRGIRLVSAAAVISPD